MVRWASPVACVVLLAQLANTAFAAEPTDPVAERPSTSEPDFVHPETDNWIDKTHQGLHTFLWRSSMTVDHWLGGEAQEDYYAGKTRGSITPIILWDQFNGLSEKFRFRVKMPLPYLDERYNAFIGTFSRDEFVTERDQASGAIPRQRVGGEVDEDETLVGVQFRDRHQGGRFEADAGIRIRSPIDPFVKGGYRFEHTTPGQTRLTLRETAFWQNSEQLGVTSRFDVERAFNEVSLLRWTASATISQRSEGVRGYSSVTYFRGLPGSRSIAAQAFTSGEFDAAVPLGEYGVRTAYRQRILRDWLVIELRPSLTWPKDLPEQKREASWGMAVGVEMFFGMDEFQARPATF